jgi:NAD(P)H dehydrogenase (quinone)
MTSIALTGAAGHLGRHAAELLLERGLRPVLLTRDPAALADLAVRGADVRRGDFADPAGLTQALAGVERLLLVSIDIVGPARVALQTAAVEAARAAGVGHVLYTSLPRPEPANPAGVAPDHLATEDALRASGLRWTFLRNNLYAEFQVPTVAQAVASGTLVTNAGAGRVAYVTRVDCADVAATVLAAGGHEDEVLELTGPEAIGAEELAALARELSGRPVEVAGVDDAAFTAGLVAAGLPAEVAGLYASFGASAREGFAERVTTTVADVTGRPPTALRDVLAASRDAIVGG